MEFKEYSPYTKFKEFVYTHRDKQFKSIISSPDYIAFIESFDTVPYRIALINDQVENRPDLISYAAYGTVGYAWLLILFNGIEDPFTEFEIDKEIKIPIL